MYDFLKTFHSHNRHLILLFAVLAIVLSLIAIVGKKPWKKANKTISLIYMILIDIQFSIGMILYFAFSSFGIKAFSNPNVNVMKDAAIRKIAVEHILIMLTAWILVHIGYSKIKRSDNPHRVVLVFYGLSLLLILAGIPWARL